MTIRDLIRELLAAIAMLACVVAIWTLLALLAF
jgi:hypothetical protein